ncbi:hypothetical protein JB92DRAFT_3135618 [Gautieria morchelliformis]|nr:hypothetical protein JB92DRAFT_3135618 [Gautieria morchelliformis]
MSKLKDRSSAGWSSDQGFLDSRCITLTRTVGVLTARASGPHARIHEDSQAHRCNVQYRKASASTVLQNNAAASGNSEGDAAVRPSVQEDEIPESGRDGWEDDLSENATDGLAIGPVHAGPSWISSSRKTVLDPSLRNTTVFELARAL